MYDQKTTFGPKEIQIKFKEQLKKAIDENFNFLKKKLAEKKVFPVIVISGVLSFKV